MDEEMRRGKREMEMEMEMMEDDGRWREEEEMEMEEIIGWRRNRAHLFLLPKSSTPLNPPYIIFILFLFSSLLFPSLLFPSQPIIFAFNLGEFFYFF